MVGGLVFSQRSVIARDLSNATKHKPETFTELYFDNYNSFVKLLKPSRSYNGQFSIVNHQANTVNYRYQVTEIENGIVVSSNPGTVWLRNEQSATLPFSYRATKIDNSVEVIITLPDFNQQIFLRAQS